MVFTIFLNWISSENSTFSQKDEKTPQNFILTKTSLYTNLDGDSRA